MKDNDGDSCQVFKILYVKMKETVIKWPITKRCVDVSKLIKDGIMK